MGSAGDLRTDQRIFRVEITGIDLLKSVPPDVVIAVAGGSLQAGLSDVGLLHGADNPELIIFGSPVNLLKASAQRLQNRLREGKHLPGDAER